MQSKPLYRTANGHAYVGDSLELLAELPDNSIDLVMTSPPFALLRQKTYGNVEETEYVRWIKPFGQDVFRVLKESGSFVLDLGGAYRSGVPSRSLYNFRVLLAFCDEIGFHLAEDFYWFNPAKLPSPIEWVNKRKIRAKDSVNTVWWFSKTASPKADVRKVLAPYSDRMRKLIEDPESFYTPNKRPSGHDISAGFGKDNGGAIPSNLLSIPNTDSNSSYLRLCKELGLERHPARFPSELPAFFIKMLTDEEDVVLDIFGGSNTTGFTAEALKRKWLTFEMSREYLAASALRFLEGHSPETMKRVLVEMNESHANYFIGETICALDPAKKAKTKNESLGQGALFVSEAGAR
ncbi:MAG: site-specific DNA-methyltransferase [Chromatiaceae bacterium]|nr:site-specific DNA-methyltransferase [Chromatiaceae bacterium]MBP8024006.1 site-specific DNA-methyltransferase [Chromatiaceae bacterium]